MKANGKFKNRSPLKRAGVGILLLLLAGVYLFFSPKYFENRLNGDPYKEWMMHEREPSVGVITVWHIVDFKPYSGSLGAWLSARTKQYASNFIGIHFDVVSYSPQDAEERIKTGVLPDIISFADGRIDESLLSGSKRPYCGTGSVLVYDPASAADKDIDSLKAEAGSFEDFKKGKSHSCITDIRGAGDLMRAQLLGKAPYFEVVPLADEARRIQFISMTRSIDGTKRRYAEGFIEYLLSPACQALFGDIGLLPANDEADVKYDPEWLSELQGGLRNAGDP